MKCISIDCDSLEYSHLHSVHCSQSVDLQLGTLSNLSEDVSNYTLVLLHTTLILYVVACTLVKACCCALHTEPTGDICYDAAQALHAASTEQV